MSPAAAGARPGPGLAPHASVPYCRSATDTTSSSAAPRLQGRVGGTLLWDRELLTFDAVKVSWEEVLPDMPRNVTQDWHFLF